MMNKSRSSGKGSYVVVILIILVASVILGFIADLAWTGIEKAIYKQPKEYQSYISLCAKEYGVPENLIYAVIRTESGFDSSAVSRAGAVGLMQMTPDTFLWLTNDKLGDRYSEGMLYDPQTNIKYGVYYLSILYSKYGSWDTALAAYNAGLGKVDTWLADSKYNPNDDMLLDSIPYRETRNYVKKVNRAKNMYDKLYGALK